RVLDAPGFVQAVDEGAVGPEWEAFLIISSQAEIPIAEGEEGLILPREFRIDTMHDEPPGVRSVVTRELPNGRVEVIRIHSTILSRSSTTISAPASRRRSRPAPLSTPTTRPKSPARPAATPDTASSNTTLRSGIAPSSAAARKNVS